MENEEKIINFEALKKQLRFENAKRKFKEGVKKLAQIPEKVIDYAVENPAKAASIAAGATMAGNRLLKYMTVAREDRRRKTDLYDPRNGDHVFVRRPLTSKEMLKLDERYKRGESKIRILTDMGLVK